MPVPTTSRRSVAARVVAATATVAAGLGAAAFVVPSAGAATSTVVAITKLSVHRLPSLTANQLITVTGTGFDEDVIRSVVLNNCTAATFIVQNPTTMLVKTDDTCTAGTGKTITITDTSGNTAVSNPSATGGTQVLDFVTAPAIATASATVKPIVTENSQSQLFANQVTTASTKGGSVIRIKAGAAGFMTSTAYPLAASVDGVPLTKVTLGTGSAYLTGVLGAHAADAAPVVKITNNGVSKSFQFGTGGGSATDQTHDFALAGNSISVSPTSTGLGGGVLTITGTGFTTGTTISVGGVNCPQTGTTSATTVHCTAAAVTAAGVKAVTTTTGSLVSVISPTSNFTFLDQ